MIGFLPKKVVVNGNDWDVRTDYRDILNIFCAFNDEELSDREKVIVCLKIFYINFDKLEFEEYEEAYKQAVIFFNQGAQERSSNKKEPKLMDWEQDEALVFSAINQVAGKEVREVEYMHWWTFMSYYLGIGEGIFSEVINIRMVLCQEKVQVKHKLFTSIICFMPHLFPYVLILSNISFHTH